MPLSKDDRIAFSLQIVKTAETVNGILVAKGQLLAQIAKVQKLDIANKNLFDPVNLLVNGYQNELAQLNGVLRTTFNEQNIQDSAYRIMDNYFYPNNLSTPVPSLASQNNIWPKTKPFALTYAIGKNQIEAFGTTTKEPDLIAAAQAFITSAASFTDMENTTGQQCAATGTCSNPIYTDQTSCTNNGGIWTPGPDAITSYAAVQTLKTNLVNAINTLKTFLLAEVAMIVTNDPDSANQTNNNAAINNINNVIIPALNTWLGYVDFNTAHGQTTCAGFNGYNSNLLAPTKLHSTQLAALQSALTTRSSFITTRVNQITTVLGSISQDLNTGDITASSGLYGKRFGFLSLRISVLSGTLADIAGSQSTINSQDSLIAEINNNKNTYMSIIPTTLFKSAGNDTTSVHLVDTSFLSPGDTVWVCAENQEELQRAVKSIDGNRVVLNDSIPAKYRPSEKARLYKDLT